MAGAVGQAGDVRGPQPLRGAGRRLGRPGRPRSVLRARHVPLSLGRRPPCRASARLHRLRQLRPVPAHAGRQSSSIPSGSTPSACPPSSTPSRPASTRRSSTAENIDTMRRQLRRLGLAHDPRRVALHRRPAVLPLDPVDLPADVRVLVRRRPAGRAAHRGPGRGARAGRPRAGLAGEPRREAVERARRGRAAPGGRLLPPRLPRRGAGQLVPGAGDGPGQRGGDRRGSLGDRELPRLPSPAAPVDAAHHRLRGPAAPGPGRPRMDRLAQDDPAELDRPQRGRRHPLHRPGRHRRHRRDRGLHHPPGHAVRRDLPGAGPRAPARGRADGPGLAARHASGLAGPGLDRGGTGRVAGRGRRRLPAAGGRAAATGNARCSRPRRRCSPAPSPPTPHPASRCPSSSPTTSWPATAAAPSWPCPPTTSATSSSPGPSGCRSGRWSGPTGDGWRTTRARCPTGPRPGARHPWTRASPSTPTAARLSLDGLGRAEATARTIRWLEESGNGRRRVSYRLRDWLFSRQRYWGEPFPIVYDETGLPIALPESMLPVELPPMSDFRPQATEERRTAAAAVAGTGLRAGDARPRRRAEDLSPRDQRHAPVGRVLLVLPALPGPGQRRALRRPGHRAVLDGRRRRRGAGRRGRPLHRRRRACRPAPAVRPVLAQGAVRPGLRVDPGAVPAAVQPGLHPGRRVHRPGRPLRAGGRGRRRRGRRLAAPRPARDPPRRQDGQEPQERRLARRHLRGVRRRHPAHVRDGDGPPGRRPGLAAGRHRGRVPLPAAALAQRDRRDDRRGAGLGGRAGRATSRCTACCTRPSTRSAPSTASCAYNVAIARLTELNNAITRHVRDRGAAPRDAVEPLVLHGGATGAAHRRRALGTARARRPARRRRLPAARRGCAGRVDHGAPGHGRRAAARRDQGRSCGQATRRCAGRRWRSGPSRGWSTRTGWPG